MNACKCTSCIARLGVCTLGPILSYPERRFAAPKSALDTRFPNIQRASHVGFMVSHLADPLIPGIRIRPCNFGTDRWLSCNRERDRWPSRIACIRRAWISRPCKRNMATYDIVLVETQLTMER